MDVLSKIGEFFFDDGHLTEEERLRQYKQYKERQRKNSPSKSSSRQQQKVVIRSRGGEQLVPVASADPIAIKIAKANAAGRAKKGLKSSRGLTAKSSQAEHSSKQASTTESVSSSLASRAPSDGSTSTGLDSMVPDTVCADLSIRSVSTKSVISHSGSDTHSHTREAGSHTGGSIASKTLDTVSEADRSAVDSVTEDDHSRSRERRSASQRKKRNDRRIRLSVKPTKSESRSSRAETRTTGTSTTGTGGYGGFLLGNPFKIALGMKSSSTNAMHLRSMSPTSTGTGIRSRDETATMEDTRLLEQIISASSSEDTDASDTLDESLTRTAPPSRGDSRTRANAPIPPSSRAGSRTRTTAADSKTRTTVADSRTHTTGPRSSKTSGSSRGTSGLRKPSTSQSSTMAKSTMARTLEKHGGAAVKASADATPHTPAENDMLSTAEKTQKTVKSIKSISSQRSKSIHGWIENPPIHAVAGDSGSGEKIELAISESCDTKLDDRTTSTREFIKDCVRKLPISPLSSRRTLSLADSDVTGTFTSKGLSKASHKSAAVPSLVMSKTDLEPVLEHLAQQTSASNVPPATAALLSSKCEVATNDQNAGTKGTVVMVNPSAQPLGIKNSDEGKKAFMEIFAKNSRSQCSHRLSSRSRSMPALMTSVMVARSPTAAAGQFFTTNLILEEPSRSPASSVASIEQSPSSHEHDVTESPINSKSKMDVSNASHKSTSDLLKEAKAKLPKFSIPSPRKLRERSQLSTPKVEEQQNVVNTAVSLQRQPRSGIVLKSISVSTSTDDDTKPSRKLIPVDLPAGASVATNVHTVDEATVGGTDGEYEFIEVTYEPKYCSLEETVPPRSPSENGDEQVQQDNVDDFDVEIKGEKMSEIEHENIEVTTTPTGAKYPPRRKFSFRRLMTRMKKDRSTKNEAEIIPNGTTEDNIRLDEHEDAEDIIKGEQEECEEGTIQHRESQSQAEAEETESKASQKEPSGGSVQKAETTTHNICEAQSQAEETAAEKSQEPTVEGAVQKTQAKTPSSSNGFLMAIQRLQEKPDKDAEGFPKAEPQFSFEVPQEPLPEPEPLPERKSIKSFFPIKFRRSMTSKLSSRVRSLSPQRRTSQKKSSTEDNIPGRKNWVRSLSLPRKRSDPKVENNDVEIEENRNKWVRHPKVEDNDTELEESRIIKWRPSLILKPRTRRDQKGGKDDKAIEDNIPHKVGEERPVQPQMTGNIPSDVPPQPLAARRTPIRAPPSDRDNQDEEESRSSLDDEDTFDDSCTDVSYGHNPWRIAHPNYGHCSGPPRIRGILCGAKASDSVSSDEVTFPDEKIERKNHLLARKREEIKMALARMITERRAEKAEKEAEKAAEKARQEALSQERIAESTPEIPNNTAQNVVEEIPIESAKKGHVRFGSLSIGSKSKSGQSLRKLKSGLKGILRKKSHWSQKPQDSNLSPEQDQVDSLNEGIEVLSVDVEEKKGVAEVFAASRSREDDAFLMQHKNMMNSRRPTWKKSARGKHFTKSGTSQSKLQRVLGRREQQKKKGSHEDSSSNSIVDARVSKLSKEDEGEPSYSNSYTNSYDNNTHDETTLGAYSVQNQRVLNTLKLLHAVKKRKYRERALLVSRFVALLVFRNICI